ncbi:DNAH [Lepeophtheirus salmonis]|uniref:DNAH n=1 Tax=Lepeophtheirus salmonis TaxID=72036 RepID=A0A7R8D1G0_LEPSM|nr:DNAH [Lepeophtheirus salmonis]CAF2968484.1 DNAH [Lepeophtheirus salmonis]
MQKKKSNQDGGFLPNYVSSSKVFRHSDSLCIPIRNTIPVQDSVSVDCLRVCIERAWIPSMDKSMLDNIIKLVPLASKHPLSIENLLEEVKKDFKNCLQRGTLQMTLSFPEESDQMNTDNRGKSLDLDSFCGNIISESEKNEELIINDWYPQILKVFADFQKMRGERQTRFHNCASSLLSIQLRGLLMKNISKYVSIFRDRRKIPRIEMELVLSENGISFQPSVNEVINMLVSVIYEMNKLLREVPTIDSWYSEGASQFVQVGLNDDFISEEVKSLKNAINNWMKEPETHHRLLSDRFEFLINGTSKAKIHDFIRKAPKFEEICQEYKSYKLFVDQTQEISSLEYFTLVRLDCENLRKSLGQAARKLSNLLLKNVVDTYREENQVICKTFEKIEKVALQSPQSTKEMIEFGEFMLNVKNKKMIDLTEEIEHSKKHLLYLIDVHVFDPHDIELNTLTLGWLVKIRPVFEQNTEIIEDCKAKFEDNLQKKEVRQIQNKLKKLDETIKWINLEEALFKFPQTTYSEVENMNINIDPYCRLFTTVLKWQKAEKKCTDGAFLDLDASQIENSINEFMEQVLLFTYYNPVLIKFILSEMSKLQKLFKLKFKQQALDGDSKYAKMNLEDSNPMNLPPPLRISALTIIQIKSFQKNIQLITCLCNPGLRKRHWIRMGSIIGFDITPNSGSSLRKMLCLNLEQYMPELEKISNMATREHGLELTLANMKTEWESNNLELMSNDRGHKILSNFESIQELIDDHTSKTETVKGSPYFRPFKNEVESWENDLKTVHDSLSSLEIVQKNYVNLESFFSKDEIISQMPLESQLFKNVKSNWIFVLEHIYSTPQVMKALNKTEVINALNDSTSLLEQIQEGLDLFTDQKCVTFPS